TQYPASIPKQPSPLQNTWRTRRRPGCRNAPADTRPPTISQVLRRRQSRLESCSSRNLVPAAWQSHSDPEAIAAFIDIHSRLLREEICQSLANVADTRSCAALFHGF